MFAKVGGGGGGGSTACTGVGGFGCDCDSCFASIDTCVMCVSRTVSRGSLKRETFFGREVE